MQIRSEISRTRLSVMATLTVVEGSVSLDDQVRFSSDPPLEIQLGGVFTATDYPDISEIVGVEFTLPVSYATIPQALPLRFVLDVAVDSEAKARLWLETMLDRIDAAVTLMREHATQIFNATRTV